MPALDHLQESLGGKDFAVVLVSQDRGGANVVGSFFAKLGRADLRTYLDPRSAVGHGFGVLGLPSRVLIDRDGTILGTVQGAADWDGAAFVAMIRSRIEAGRTTSAARKWLVDSSATRAHRSTAETATPTAIERFIRRSRTGRATTDETCRAGPETSAARPAECAASPPGSATRRP
jgi:hypothetical protein